MILPAAAIRLTSSSLFLSYPSKYQYADVKATKEATLDFDFRKSTTLLLIYFDARMVASRCVPCHYDWKRSLKLLNMRSFRLKKSLLNKSDHTVTLVEIVPALVLADFV